MARRLDQVRSEELSEKEKEKDLKTKENERKRRKGQRHDVLLRFLPNLLGA